MHRKAISFLVSSALGAALLAQEGDGLPTEYVLQVAPGSWIDLDTGMLLPRPVARSLQADLRFSRDGAGFFLEPVFGGSAARAGDTAPPETMPKERVRIDRQHPGLLMFARTDRGMARVELMVADPYSTASASLRWVVVPPKNPVFLAPPSDLQASWVGNRLQVAWNGEAPRWLVDVRTGETSRRVTVDGPRVLLDELPVDQRHQILVRGLFANGDVSMPADVVMFGKRQTPWDGTVEYAARWYDQCGGLSLSTGAAAVEAAEVVFYLYGVFVPGGGVAKVGTGEFAFAALHELPAGPFPPVYGRLDDNDVLVVRLGDGRYGKLWLEPMRGDVRDGMRVHVVFLPDGRRTLLPPPTALASERTAEGPRLQWQASEGAVRYRVLVGGKALATEPTVPTIVLTGLAAQRIHEVEVVAIAGDGEVSATARTVVHTYDADVRIASGSVAAQRVGYDFARGERVAAGKPSDLALVGGAGGASVLHFAGAAIAPGAGFAFGEFPPPERLAFAETWSSDSRTAGCDLFYVRTADGGIASVRIVARAWPEPKFEYVWVPKR